MREKLRVIRRRLIDVTRAVAEPPCAPPSGIARLVERYTPSFYLDVGSECALHCVYCCVPRGVNDDEVRTETEESLRGALRTAGQHGLKKVALLGGEPAQRKDFFDLCKAARDAGFEEVILTTKSARLADPEFIDQLVRHGVTIVHLSLDAFDPELLASIIGGRRAATALLQAFDNLLARPDIDTYLYAVLARANLGSFDAYVRRVAELSQRHGVTVPVILAGMKVLARADRNETSILPRAADAAAAAREAIALGKTLGVPIATRHLQPCLLGELRTHALEAYIRDARVDLDTAEVLPPERDEWTARVDACGACSCATWCDGVQRRYVAIAGEGEFVAVR